MITLGIDYGASNVGIALVRNTESGNEPLFAGTIVIDHMRIKDKVQPRASIRRLRRTRKTKKARLRELRAKLTGLRIEDGLINRIVRFCERRGYSYEDKTDAKQEAAEEMLYKVHRTTFFKSLDEELKRCFENPAVQEQVIVICKNIFNHDLNPQQEPRPVKIDNRGISRCAWEGCNKVPPRRSNAISGAVIQQLVTYFQGILKDNRGLLEHVEQSASQLSLLSKQLQNADNEAKKALKKRARACLKEMRDKLIAQQETNEEMDAAWKYVRDGVINIIEKTGGRNTYCREHSKAYVDTVLAGKQAPFKKTISESDILSRREQIIFGKLWRYIEARLLPLVPEGIDRIVVERTAFDILAGSRKTINKASDKRIEDIYQQGPMYGFDSVGQMLHEEFGGLCAYCGQASSSLLEREHILPRSQFFFDSYLNILPSCTSCNAEKGARLVGAASLHISDAAYGQYENYLNGIKANRPLHFLHTEKKGILNLMRDPKRAWEVEQYLGLIANNFAAITQSQRGPRPLARFLYTKLSTKQAKAPQILFGNGRHTALYRTIAYPDFQKAEDKSIGGKANHALDAVLLASKLPDPKPLEARGLNVHNIGTWRRSVMSQAPRAETSVIPPIPVQSWFVDGFEMLDDYGYATIEMARMNWNQKDTATHKQDPYGFSEKYNKPTKRASALGLSEDLNKEKDPKKIKNIVDNIFHPQLRKAMESALNSSTPGPDVAMAMTKWLRQSVKNSMAKSSFSNHPADQARKQQLENFAREDSYPIPKVMGVKCFDIGVKGKIDIERLDARTGGIGSHYMADPANRGMVLAYPRKANGDVDLKTPYIAGIRQNLSLKPDGKKFIPMPGLLENGTIWGDKRTSDREWRKTLEEYLFDCGFHSYVFLTSGCVIRYIDGTERFIRNFDKSKEFKKGILKNVVGVRSTPYTEHFVGLKLLTVGLG